jgi:hypothetical protein
MKIMAGCYTTFLKSLTQTRMEFPKRKVPFSLARLPFDFMIILNKRVSPSKKLKKAYLLRTTPTAL